MAETLSFDSVCSIGSNNHYVFGVGLLKGDWFGFAIGKTKNGQMLFLFPNCDSQDMPEPRDSSKNRDEVIKRTGAYAQCPETIYGGVRHWFIDEDLRGKPEDYICPECRSVCCSAADHDDSNF